MANSDRETAVTRLLSARELAENLGVHVQTVLVWAREGKLPSYKLPAGQIRFDELDVEAWLAERKVGVRESRLTVVQGKED